METIKPILAICDRAVERVTRWGVVTALGVLFTMLLLRVFARATGIAFSAFDELGELATIWAIVLGVVALWREGTLYRVDMFLARSGKVAFWQELVIQLLMLVFAGMLVWIGYAYAFSIREVTAFMQIDMLFYYGSIPLGALVMAVYTAGRLVRLVRAQLCSDPAMLRGLLNRPETADHL